FSLNFPSISHKTEWDKFVTIAPIQYTRPIIGLPVELAGYGCAKKDFGTDASGSIDTVVGSIPTLLVPIAKCIEETNFRYMKTALNQILELDGPNFLLDGRSSKEMVTGFISDGDSGGPVYGRNGSLIGVNSAGTNGLFVFDDAYGMETIHVWLGFPLAQSFIFASLSEDTKQLPFALTILKHEVTFGDGATYIGSMRMGARNGKGKMFYADGRVYDGAWTLDKREGNGVQWWDPNDPKFIDYKGNWSNEKMNGTGILTFRNGEIYEGQFQDNLFHGKGRRTLPNKDIREGSWVKGELEGECILTTAAGSRWKEIYIAGKRVSAVKL
ncbi:MAG: hypothetical protein EOP04_20145, partial [Proteobacteria bacterium]